MQKFTGGFGTRFNFLLWLVLGLCCYYFASAIFARAHDAATWAGTALFFFISSMGTFTGLYGLAESFTVYEVSGEGVTRKGWNGTRTMRWQDVTRLDVSGQRDSELILRGNQGQKLAIGRGLLGSKRTAELNALLELHLAPIRERQMREVGGVDTVYYPRRGAAWAGAILLAMMVPTFVFFLSMPVKSGEWWMFALIMALLGGSCLFGLWMTVSFYTQTLTVTPHDLTDRTLFRTRSIPLHHVTSVSSRMVQTKNGSFELTTVEGDGQKIALTSQMKDYALVRDYIKQHTGETARQEGEAQAQQANAQLQKQQRVIVPIFALIAFVFLGGLGLMQVRDGRARLERYHLMDTQGLTTSGRVTGRSMDGPKGYRYLLRYAFMDKNSLHRESASPVSYQDYQNIPVGAPVRVTYVPGRTDMCYITQSLGKRKAEGDIRSGYLSIGMACILPPLLVLTVFRKRPKTSQSAG